MRTYHMHAHTCEITRKRKEEKKIFDLLKKTEKCRQDLHISKKSSTFAASKVKHNDIWKM